MKRKENSYILACLTLILMLAACTPAPTAAPPAAVPSPTTVVPTAGFSDPFAYCQAVGNADTPGPQYGGPKMNETLAQAIKKASGASADAPLDIFMRGSSWRCMNGRVYGCFVGANLPCDARANVDKTPTTAENDFCRTNPQADGIPAAVSGHDTVYEWLCKDGKAVVGKQVFQVDGRGYIADIWYALPAP